MAEIPAIEAEALVKTFGATVALNGLDLCVPQGGILGLLGPNGAGKTTAVRVLATLLRPDAGRARVLGADVITHAADVRRSIGLTGQYAALDNSLTGRANLVMVGRLSRLSRAEAWARAARLAYPVASARASASARVSCWAASPAGVTKPKVRRRKRWR